MINNEEVLQSIQDEIGKIFEVVGENAPSLNFLDLWCKFVHHNDITNHNHVEIAVKFDEYLQELNQLEEPHDK